MLYIIYMLYIYMLCVYIYIMYESVYKSDILI